MTAFAVLYNGWLPLPLIQRTARHVIGTVVTLLAFHVVVKITEALIQEQWLKDKLHAIHIFVVLFIAGLLAVELLVSFARDVWEGSKGEKP